MVIFRFWHFAFRGWSQHRCSAVLPSMEVHASASTLAVFNSCFNKSIGNSSQGLHIVRMDSSVTRILILSIGCLGARLPFWSTIVGVVFSLIPTLQKLPFLVFFLNSWGVILRRLLLL
jgi:hypothetical protein